MKNNIKPNLFESNMINKIIKKKNKSKNKINIGNCIFCFLKRNIVYIIIIILIIFLLKTRYKITKKNKKIKKNVI